jgi:hypothetical protein
LLIILYGEEKIMSVKVTRLVSGWTVNKLEPKGVRNISEPSTVVRIEAEGKELSMIMEQVTGIRKSYSTGYVVWSDPMDAQFIAYNVRFDLEPVVL